MSARKSYFFQLSIFALLSIFVLSCDSDSDVQPDNNDELDTLVSKDSSDTVVIVDVPLSAPLNLRSSALTAEKMTITWDEVSEASTYRIDVSLNSSFSDFLDSNENRLAGSNEVSVSKLLYQTNYYVRVRSVSGDETSENSETFTVTTPKIDSEPEEGERKGLKSLTDFPIGVAIKSSNLSGSFDEVIRKNFNSLTAEYEMKMDQIFKGEGEYDFDRVDQIIDYAESIGAQVHGHALIWHSSIPSWLNSYDGTDEEFETLIEDYIDTVVSRYAGRVVSWDVVNEAVGDENGTMRPTLFLARMGPGYVQKCFQFARNADENSLLFYNDYSIEWDETKLNASLALLDDNVDGVGFQMHVSDSWPTKDRLKSQTQKVVDEGYMVHYSEVDVRMNDNSNESEFSTALALKQKAKYKEIAEAFMEVVPVDKRFAFTVWGFRDNESWIPDVFDQEVDWPLLFDDNFNAKPSHTGLVEAFEGE